MFELVQYMTSVSRGIRQEKYWMENVHLFLYGCNVGECILFGKT